MSKSPRILYSTINAILLLWILYDFRLTDQGIDFVLLRFIPVATVRYENIDFVEKQTNPLSPLTAYRFVNRFGPRYVIHKKEAWFSKYVVLSPPDGDALERILREANVAVRSPGKSDSAR